jgi:hypothetical protein
MSRAARFRVFGRFDAPRAHEATVTIERERGLFSVRPLRRRRVYELPLADVAAMVVWRVIRFELAEKKRERAAARRRKGSQ